MFYPQLEGFTSRLYRHIPQLPPDDYSGLRKRILSLDPDPYKNLNNSEEELVANVDVYHMRVNL